MDTRESSLQSRGWRDLHGLQHGLFQTSTDRSQLRAAVYQVFGAQPWGGCCSDRLLETLLEAGQRSYLKQQLYWDFQLLDSDHDGYLSVRDAELLLAQVPNAYATGESWQEFLRSRGPAVAWRDIEDWLFRAIQLPADEPRAGRRRALYQELGASTGSGTSLYRWGVRSRVEQPLERWESGAPATLLGEEPSGVLAALERKYRVLQRKLCSEMLQAHYGPPSWASLPQNVKEDKLSELELLVDCGLRKGSVLSLACLPGARLSVRSAVQAFESEERIQCVSPTGTEGTAAQALEELRRRRQVETAAVLAQQHLLVGSNPEASRRLLHLHAQIVLVQQEASFQAAVLITELFQGESFWDSKPIVPEACHQELAKLRLAAGHGSEPAWREAKMMPGRSMMQVLLDRLLLQHEKDRACLVHVLLTLAGTETTRGHTPGGQQLSLPGAGCRDDASPALREAIGQMLSLAQKRLEVAGRAMAPWQDCAVAVLADLQLAQEEELRQTIEDLVGIISGREGESCPVLYEKLLSRLQEPLLMSLIRNLQPVPPQERHTWEPLKMGPGTSANELSAAELEDGPKGPSLKKLKTCEHQDGEDADENENRTADQQRSLEMFLLQTKSKSWGPPEFVRPQVLMPKELRNRAVFPQIPQAGHNLGGHCKEETLGCQALKDSRYFTQGDRREATDLQSQVLSRPEFNEHPGKEQKAVQVPEKEPETSIMAKSHDQQKVDGPSKKTQESCPQELRNTKACQTEPFYSQDKLPKHLSRPRAKSKKAKKESDTQVALSRKTKSDKPKEMSKSQDTIPPGSIHAQEKPGRRPEDFLQGAHKVSAQGLKTPEKKSLGTIQEQKEPQNHYETLQRKSKSLEPRRPPAFPSQEVNVSCKQGPTQIGSGAFESMEQTQPEDPQSQKWRQKPQSDQREELPQKQGMAQQGPEMAGPQATKAREDFPPEKKICGKPQIQEYGRPESPPLLWRVLWQKAKSFDVGKPYVFPIQKLRKLEEALTQGTSQKMRGSPMAQLQFHKLQEDKRPDSPPLLWRILWQKSKSFEVRKSVAFETREMRGSLIVQLQQGGSQMKPELRKLPEPKILREAAHLMQRTRKVETSQGNGSPQIKTRALEESPRLKDAAVDVQEWWHPQAVQSETSQAKTESESKFHPQDGRDSETPPLLWRVLGMKAKSFELTGPCAFRTQQARKPEPSFLASQATKRLETTQRWRDPHVAPESQKYGTPKICYPQELRDPGPQRHPKISQSGRILPQGLGAPQMETEPERRSPETPPLMWWVLEMGRQGMSHRHVEEVGLVPLQESAHLDPPDTSPGGKNTCRPKDRRGLETSMTQENATEGCNPTPTKDRRGLETSMTQENVTEGCYPNKAGCCCGPPTGKPRAPGNPHPMKAQGVPQCDPEGLSCSDLSEGEKIKTANCPAPETPGHHKADSLLPPGKRFERSKSFDFRELRPPKPPELRELESPEAQGRPKVVLVQEDSQMKARELQLPEHPQAQEKSDLEDLQAHGAQSPLQPRGPGGEIHLPLPSSLHLKSAELMEPHILKPQELVVLHVQGTVQVDPEALKFQRHLDSTPICPQGYQEAGSSGCESRVEDKPTETQRSSQTTPQICLAQGTAELQADLLQDSTSFGPQEQSKLRSFQIQEKEARGCPRVPEDEALKRLETFAPQVTTQMVTNPLQDSKVLESKDKSAGQEEPTHQDVSQPQEETEENKPGASDPPEYANICVHQKDIEDLQPSGVLQTEHTPVSFGATDPRHSRDLQVEETPPKKPEATEDGKPSNWLFPGYSELWEFWRILGKSKSLDPRELQFLHSEALGKSEFSRLPDTSSAEIWQSQRKPQDDPMDINSKFLPIHELILKDQAIRQPQDRGDCDGPHEVGLAPPQAQEPLRTPGEIFSSQELEDAQIFCPKRCEVTEAGEEFPQVSRATERQSEAVEAQGLTEPKPLTPHENRDVESPALLKGLLRKSKTFGPQRRARKDSLNVQSVGKSHSGQHTPVTPLQGQGSPRIQGPSKESQEMLKDFEGTLEPPVPETAETQGLMDPKPLTPQENRDVESPALLKGLLRKSKTFGPQRRARKDSFNDQSVGKSHSGQDTPMTPLQGQGSPRIQGPSKGSQEMLKDFEGTLEPPVPETAEAQGRMEPKPLTPQENRDVESPALLKGLLRKSETFGPQRRPRKDSFNVQSVGKSHSGQHTPMTPLQGQGSPSIQGPSKESQEMLKDFEGTLEPPVPETAEPQGLMEPKPLTPQENRDVESPALLKGLLRKSETFGPQRKARKDSFNVQSVGKSHSGQHTPMTPLQGQGSPSIQGPSKESQEMLKDFEGTLEPPITEKVEFPREVSTKDMAMAVGEGFLPIGYDIQREQGEAPFTSPEWSQALPPSQGPQFGDKLLQELGRLHMERETCGPQDWEDLEGAHPQKTEEFFESEGQGAIELGPHLPQHLERQRKQSHQVPPVEQKISPPPGQEEEKQESPEMFNMESGSRGLPKLEAPQTFQRQERLPETSPVVPIVRVFHPLNSQGFIDPAIFCPQEPSEVGWEPLKDKEIQMDLGCSELQEHLPVVLQGTWQWKSKSLDPQKLSRTWDLHGQSGTDGLHAQYEEHRQLVQETTETKKPPVVTACSPPSSGRHEEEIPWEPAALRVGMSRENSSCEIPPGRPSEQSWHAQDADVPTEGAPEPTQPESQEPKARPLLSPRPPRREKAFIWLSRQEQEEALKQLAELRAEGELRHRRDKERQSLRFQERLSIAKHRKSEDDILGGSPAERWPSPTEHLDQDQAGQKTAVKRHLETVKRERTYVMQSKRERNTMRFKELLDPLVAPGEESPEPREPGGE